MSKRSDKHQQDSPPDSDSDSVSGGMADEHHMEADGTGDDALFAGNIADKIAADIQYDDQPQTRCSNCQTVFEVSPELLTSDDTRVRCGECLCVFDALLNLRTSTVEDDGGEFLDGDSDSADAYTRATLTAKDDFSENREYPGLPGVTDDQSQGNEGLDFESADLDSTYSDFDLFSGEAGLPEIAYFDQTQDTERLRFDEPDGDETYNEALFPHDLTVESPNFPATSEVKSLSLERESISHDVDFVTDDVPRDPLVFTYRDAEQEQPSASSIDTDQTITGSMPGEILLSNERGRSGRSWLTRSMLATLLILIVVGLYGYGNRSAMLHSESVRPWLVRACSVFGCNLPPLVNLDAFKVLKRTVFSHPTIKNALVIDLAFVNQAKFRQPHPVLEIRLTDRNGGLVVKNIIPPTQYMDNWQSGDLLDAGERLDLSLTFEDPGNTATSLVLRFSE